MRTVCCLSACARIHCHPNRGLARCSVWDQTVATAWTSCHPTWHSTLPRRYTITRCIYQEPEVRGHPNDASQAVKHHDITDGKAGLEPGLYIVSTPIGNLKDVTIRALEVLKSADVILAEDTRHTRKLLNFYDIKTALQSFHAHNEKGKESVMLDKLTLGQVIALVSDAGTPAISDPGAMLVAAAVQRGIKVFPVPGASAVLAAVVAAGLPTERFMFCGFLPPKAGERRRSLASLKDQECTLVFYVSPHNLPAVLADAAAELGAERQCCLARELTKLHEEFLRCSLAEAAAQYAEREPRGEYVLLVAGAPEATEDMAAADVTALLRQHLKAGLSVSAAAKLAAQQLGMPRKALYEVALKLSQAAL